MRKMIIHLRQCSQRRQNPSTRNDDRVFDCLFALGSARTCRCVAVENRWHLVNVLTTAQMKLERILSIHWYSMLLLRLPAKLLKHSHWICSLENIAVLFWSDSWHCAPDCFSCQKLLIVALMAIRLFSFSVGITSQLLINISAEWRSSPTAYRDQCIVNEDSVYVYTSIVIHRVHQNKKNKKLTTLGIPRRSPIQVLTEPDVA